MPSCTFTTPTHSLTVVGEACFAETHEQMLLYFIWCHKLGANRTVETWEENTKTGTWGSRCANGSLTPLYWYVHKTKCGTSSWVWSLTAFHDLNTCVHLSALSAVNNLLQSTFLLKPSYCLYPSFNFFFTFSVTVCANVKLTTNTHHLNVYCTVHVD